MRADLRLIVERVEHANGERRRHELLDLVEADPSDLRGLSRRVRTPVMLGCRGSRYGLARAVGRAGGRWWCE